MDPNNNPNFLQNNLNLNPIPSLLPQNILPLPQPQPQQQPQQQTQQVIDLLAPKQLQENQTNNNNISSINLLQEQQPQIQPIQQQQINPLQCLSLLQPITQPIDSQNTDNNNTEQQQTEQNNQQNSQTKQAQKESKNLQFSIKNVTNNFSVIAAKFGFVQTKDNGRYFSTIRQKNMELYGNFVLASKNSIRIYQVFKYELDEQMLKDKNMNKVEIKFYQEFSIEGVIEDIELFNDKTEPFSQYILIQLEWDKLSIVKLDNTDSNYLKTINMYNFENQGIFKRLGLNEVQKGKNIMRVEKGNHVKLVGITAGHRSVLVILVYLQRLRFPKDIEYYEKCRLKFNADYFDCWTPSEDQRIFGPSIYIDLKKDLNVHNIIDYMFDETVRNSHEINKQNLYILDLKLVGKEKKNDDEQVFQHNKLRDNQTLDEKMQDQLLISDRPEDIEPQLYCQLIQIKIVSFLAKKDSNTSVFEEVKSFQETPIGSVLSKLPYDAFKLITLENGALLIFCKYFICCYQPQLQNLKILALKSTEELKETYDLSELEHHISQNYTLDIPDFEGGLENAQISLLDQTKISVLKEKRVYLLYIYYKRNEDHYAIDHMKFIDSTIADLTIPVQTVCAKQFTDIDNTFFYFIGNNYLDSYFYFLSSNTDEQEVKKKMNIEGIDPGLFRLKNYELKILHKIESLQSILDYSGNPKQSYGVIGCQEKTQLMAFRNSLQMVKNERLTSGFSQIQEVEKVFYINQSYFLISFSAHKNGNKNMVLKITEDKNIEECTDNIFIIDEKTYGIQESGFVVLPKRPPVSKAQSKTEETKTKQEEKPEQKEDTKMEEETDKKKKSKKDKKAQQSDKKKKGPQTWHLYIQVCQSKIRLIDLKNQKFRDIEIEKQEIYKFQVAYNFIFLRGKLNNYLITLDIGETDLQTIQYDIQKMENVFQFGDLTLVDFSLFKSNIQKQKTQKNSYHLSCIFLEDELQIFEINISAQTYKIKQSKVFRTIYIREGLSYLRNQAQGDILDSNTKNMTVNSISDPSFQENHFVQRLSKSIYICEIAMQVFQDGLIMVLRVNDGDLYIYKGILTTQNKEFPFNFTRVVLDINKFMPHLTRLVNDNEPVNKNVLERKQSSFLDSELIQNQIKKNSSQIQEEKDNISEHSHNTSNQPQLSEQQLSKNVSNIDYLQSRQVIIQHLKEVYEQDSSDVLGSTCFLGSLDNKLQTQFLIIMSKKPLCIFMKNNQVFVHNMDIQLENFTGMTQFAFTNEGKSTIFVENNQLSIYNYQQQNSNYDYFHSLPTFQLDTQNWNSQKLSVKYVESIKGNTDQNYIFTVCKKHPVSQENLTAMKEQGRPYTPYECSILREKNQEFELISKYDGFYENEVIYKVKVIENIQLVDFSLKPVIGILSYYFENNDEQNIRSNLRILGFNDYKPTDLCLFYLDQYETPSIIYDFTVLSKQKDDISFVVLEKEKVNIFQLDPQSQKLIPLKKDLYLQDKCMVTCAKSLKDSNIFVVGDAMKGFETQIFSWRKQIINERETRDRELDAYHRSQSMFVRDLEIFSLGDKIKVLAFDENQNVYCYSMLSGGKTQKIVDLHLSSKISKLINYQENDEMVSFQGVFTDGNICEIKISLHSERPRFLQNFQDLLIEELPFIAGLNPKEISSIQNYKADSIMKVRNGFADIKFIDIFFNLSRPLQKIFSNKTQLDKEELIAFIEDNLDINNTSKQQKP